VAANPATPPGLGTSSAAPFALAIAARLVTRVDGKVAGTVDFQQTATGLTVRLGSIVDVLSDRYDPAQIARIQSSTARNVYLSLTDLQAQGIPISYDPVYDEFNVGQTDTRPRSARKVHIDQISAPERGQGSAAIGQVRRP